MESDKQQPLYGLAQAIQNSTLSTVPDSVSVVAEQLEPPSYLDQFPPELRIAIFECCDHRTINQLRCTSKSMRNQIEEYCYRSRFFNVAADEGLYTMGHPPSCRSRGPARTWDYWNHLEACCNEGIDLAASTHIRKMVLIRVCPRIIPPAKTKQWLWSLRHVFPSLAYLSLIPGCWLAGGSPLWQTGIPEYWKIDFNKPDLESALTSITRPTNWIGLDSSDQMKVPVAFSPLFLMLNFGHTAKRFQRSRTETAKIEAEVSSRLGQGEKPRFYRDKSLEELQSQLVVLKELERRLCGRNGRLDEDRFRKFEVEFQSQLDTIAQVVLSHYPMLAGNFPVANAVLRKKLPFNLCPATATLGGSPGQTYGYSAETDRWSLVPRY
jgi:hypothetical protein